MVGTRSALDGTVSSLQGDQFVARVADGAGHGMELTAKLNIDSASKTVTGTLSGRPTGAGR